MSADVPPDGEREALARLILGYDPRELRNATPHDWQLWGRFLERADAIIASDVWRNRRQGPITDEMVEAAARALAETFGEPPYLPWEGWGELSRDGFRADARAALEAAERARSAVPSTATEQEKP